MTINGKTVTSYKDLFIPEVVEAGIDENYPKFFKFMEYTYDDTTLQGKAGDEISYTAYKYAGDAVDIKEGEAIPANGLISISDKATISKAGKGIMVTYETIENNGNDPVGQVSIELAKSIANKDNKDVLNLLVNSTNVLKYYRGATGTVQAEDILEALALFGDEEFEDMSLLISTSDYPAFKKSEGFMESTDYGAQMQINGLKGMFEGCKVKTYAKLKSGEAFIIVGKPIKQLRKRNYTIETEVDKEHQAITNYGTKVRGFQLIRPDHVIRIVNEVAPTLYDVSFNVPANASAIDSQSVVSGELAVRPVDPIIAGDKKFKNWYTEAKFTNVYDFATAVTANTVLYGKFE